jgi:hypothetical protein
MPWSAKSRVCQFVTWRNALSLCMLDRRLDTVRRGLKVEESTLNGMTACAHNRNPGAVLNLTTRSGGPAHGRANAALGSSDFQKSRTGAGRTSPQSPRQPVRYSLRSTIITL